MLHAVELAQLLDLPLEPFLERLVVGDVPEGHDDAVDTVWVLMDPTVFDRLTRLRNWPPASYERWIASSLARLLTEGT